MVLRSATVVDLWVPLPWLSATRIRPPRPRYEEACSPAAPPDPKRWLLHPSVPVDVRLLGGLAALLGTYTLYNQARVHRQRGAKRLS